MIFKSILEFVSRWFLAFFGIVLLIFSVFDKVTYHFESTYFDWISATIGFLFFAYFLILPVTVIFIIAKLFTRNWTSLIQLLLSGLVLIICIFLVSLIDPPTPNSLIGI